MDRVLTEALVAHLADCITPQRRARMEAVLSRRTRFVTVALEDVYQAHNVSAVLRSCECFGVQDVHVIEHRNPYHVSPGVELGASQWLTLVRYRQPGEDNTGACLRALQDRGYRLLAAVPGRGAQPLDEVDLDRPTAVLFGTEKDGLTPAALAAAVGSVEIPMFGFTSSFNVSVSAALILRELTRRLRATRSDWGLTEDEKLALLLEWLRRTIKGSALVEERFLGGAPPPREAPCSSP